MHGLIVVMALMTDVSVGPKNRSSNDHKRHRCSNELRRYVISSDAQHGFLLLTAEATIWLSSRVTSIAVG